MSFPVTSSAGAEWRRYRWLPSLIVLMTVLALGLGTFLLRYVERHLVAASGEELMLAAAEVADKLDRLLFERYGDAQMMARAFALRASDRAFLTGYLDWMKTAYAPMYAWLGVTNQQGIMIAATDEHLVGQDYNRSAWFQAARVRREIVSDDVMIHDADNGVETVGFSAPILDSQGNFLGVVTSRIAVPTIEEVTTRTIRSLEQRSGFVGSVEYQMLTRSGRVFVDSDLEHKGNLNLLSMGLPSAAASRDGGPGFIEEEHLRRHVGVVTGYASTKGFDDFPGYGWTVLMRMDRDYVLQPIRSILWKVGIAGTVVWVPLLVLLLWSTSRLRAECRQAQQESAWARAAEAALLQSQERNRAIVDTALDGVVTIDAAGIVTDWNAQAAAIFGWSRQEALGRLLTDTIIPARDRDAHFKGIQEFLRTSEGSILNRRVEITARHKDGREFPVELSVSPARIGEAYIFSAFIRDITDRRRTERRLASQYAVTRVLSESRTLEEAVPKIIQAVGESLEWDLGVFWRFDKPTGTLRCLDQWKSASIEADEFVMATWRQVFKPGAGLPGRIWESGQPVWITDVAQDGNFLRAEAAAKGGLHGAFGFPIRVAGDVEGVVELFSRQVREPDDELLKMVADIGLKIGQFGERARAEDALHQTEAQLRQSQKMEAVGRLAGGVAHDFNNLLTVIRGYSELILTRLAPTDPMHREMEEVKKAADRAAGLTGQLLAFSRRQFVSAKVVDLNAVIMNMDGMLRRLLGEDIIELCADLDQQLGSIKADPGQIEQVIMNLAVNARDAMPTGGRLTIETRNVTIGKGPRRETMVLEEGSYVLLAVRDTGHGMNEETQSHLFEPFFTTKEKGKGTGLGLSTVYGIVKQSGGTIGVESKQGRGTTFKIFFPRVDEAAQRADVGTGAAGHARGRETILLVEDEPAVRGLVHEALRLHGYTVLVARHGIEALLTGAKHLGPIHLLLTDVVMPQMSGPEVAEKLTAVRPDMKVLYMSGYPDHPVFSQGVKRETAFLQKPFTPNVLMQKVREVLDSVKVA
ncbi:PAS domain S-box protein [Nitrospira moscoviensis]|uniref:histidine kinase n=1 Tax=Nitrospira moscoviensis TaxID=42253 RepID=A0A0K2GHM6_NITMO|nr:PAS domain S-box protein [Nitrospira moscoviensis]ALA60458.1 putative Hybrid sensor histidine kinase [Nitrospira moscoviensis]